MRKVRVTGMPMQYGGNNNPYIPYVSGMPQAPVTPEERSQWNRVAGQMRQQPGTYVRNWDHNQDFQNQFMQSQGFDPNRVSAIQADMLQRNQSMPGTVTYGPQGISKVDNWTGSKTKDQRYVQYQYQHLDAHGNQYPGAAGFTDRGTEPMSKEEMGNWNNSAYSHPHEWMTNDQGVPMNATQSEIERLYPSASGKPTASAFPTRDESIANWKARGKTSIGQDDSGPAPDYSIDSVRAGNTAAYGGIRRKVRITHTPYGREDTHDPTKQGTIPPHAQFGGQQSSVPGGTGKYAEQQSGHGYALNRFWSSPAGYPGTSSKLNPYGKVGNTLPEAQDGGDINAEKQERVLGDFDQDGSMELMNVNGPSHAEGGKDVNIPANSFVYSDTKDLKIKDANVLAMFGIQPKRGGYTPAEIAKKYDLNKYKGILSNPDADNYAHTTAQLMSDSYMAKLNKLALIQEQMKGHMGMPNSATGTAQYGGSMANSFANMEVAKNVPAPYNMYEFQTGGNTNMFENNYNQLVNKTTSYLQNMYPGKKVEVRQSSGDRNIRTQGANLRNGSSQTPVSLHNAGAARDYHIYLDGKYVNNKDFDTYKNSLWKAAEDLKMYHLNGNPPDETDPHPFGKVDPYHISMVKESNDKTAYSRLLQQYPQVRNTPLFKDTESYLATANDPVSKWVYQQIQNSNHKQLGGAHYTGSKVPKTSKDWMDFQEFMKTGIPQTNGYVPSEGQEVPTAEDYQEWANNHGAKLSVDGKVGVNTYGWKLPYKPNFAPHGDMPDDLDPGIVPPAKQEDQVATNDPYYNLVPWAGNSSVNPSATNQSPYKNVDISKNNTNNQNSVDNRFRINPNFLGNMFNVLQMAQVHKFKPWEPVPQAVIPDTVFMDPTRAIAAQQEEARSASDLDYMGDQRAARATGLARQGIAGKQAADVIGQYTNQNVGIANQANQQAAAITNDLYQRQANRIAELNKAGFLADRDYQREMGRLQAEMIDRTQKEHDNRVKTAWLNKTSPFFNVNPIDQMPDFKSERAQSEFYKQVYGIGAGSGQGSSDKEGAAGKYAQRLMEVYPGLTMAEAAKWARQEMGLMGRESEIYKPGAMVPTMRYTGLPVGSGQPNTYGMPQYAMGGMVEVPKTAKLKKFMRA